MSTTSNWEFSQKFTSEFQASRIELRSLIASAQTNAAPATLQELSLQLGRLSKSLTDATGSVPRYDQKLYETQVKQLERDIESLRSTTSAKNKFSFKRKAQPQAEPPPPIASSSPLLTELVDEAPKPTAEPSPSAASSLIRNLTLQSQSFRYITADDLELLNAPSTPDLTISNLNDCIVNLLPHFNKQLSAKPFGAYHIRNLTNCIVLLPFCPGSALIHELTNCTVALGSHQFRMHDSKDVDIYLEIASNPIIETCHKIRFALYPVKLDPEQLHRPPPPPLAVQDFSHIRSSPSPNFSLLMDKLAIEAKPWPLTKLLTPEEVARAIAAFSV